MKTTSKLFIYAIGIFTLFSCSDSDSENLETKSPVSRELSLEGTEFMAAELNKINDFGDPMSYYNWNSQRALFYKNERLNSQPSDPRMSIYNYCNELLKSGDSKTCITELENYLNEAKKPYSEIINHDNYILFEMLAIAYLRLGEQENCQRSHNEYSCIVPLKKPAIHDLEQGSRKAIEIFMLLQNYYPMERNKWLINLAFMTLGEYPKGVPTDQLLNFPNWKTEQRSFPRFKEIAVNTGLAADGLFGGTCVDDFNNDGLLDVFATDGNMRNPVQLFINDGKGGYIDQTEKAGLAKILGGVNSVHADYDNDGYKDIFIVRGGWYGDSGKQPNSLLHNNGDGTFKDVTKTAGLLSYHPSHSAAWADFNKDGYLDLFVGNESEVSPHASELFRNNGDGTFTEISALHGLGQINKFVKGVAFGDINNDGWPDLYISDVRGNNLLFKNQNGQFFDISEQAGVTAPFHSFPCWFFDANNDGFQDIYVCAYDMTDLFDIAGDFSRELQGLEIKTEKPRLYINNGNETFSDQTEKYMLSKTMYGMGANFGDLDNDGFLDFYIGTGAPEFATVVPNRMFRNVNGEKFEEVTSAGGFGHIQKGHGVSFSDMDNDGDQDIYAVMGGAFEGDNFTNVLFENPGFKNNWITIELEGITTNKDGIGSRIEAEFDSGEKYYQFVGTGGSYGSSSIQTEMGLGKFKSIKKLTIYWQNGAVQSFTDITSNQKIKITEGKSNYQTIDYPSIPFKMDGKHVHQH